MSRSKGRKAGSMGRKTKGTDETKQYNQLHPRLQQGESATAAMATMFPKYPIEHQEL